MGWGDTQLKVHLARLVDLELLVVHRLTTGAFGYELLWNPPTGTEAGGRFLAGLTDPATLLHTPPASGYDTPPVGVQAPIRTYDPEPVGARPALVGPWSGPGRSVVGARSQAGSQVPNEDETTPEVLRWAAGGGS